MPTRVTRTIRDGEEEEEEQDENVVRRNPRRDVAKKTTSMQEPQDDEDNESLSSSESATNEDDDDDESLDVDDDEEEAPRRSTRRRTKKKEQVLAPNNDKENRRKSSRSTKFTSSMKEPSGESIQDLWVEESPKKKAKPDHNKNPATPPQSRRRSSIPKSPAVRHSSLRRRVKTQVLVSSEGESSESEPENHYEDDEDELEDMKVQRILASRTEPLGKWKTICQNINTSEIDYGSRWFQESHKGRNDQDFEERFLIKWADLSYLHCSWETEQDLLDQVEGCKTYMTTFFRKSENGLLLSADERCDGDYFDPAYCQIDRILEIHRDDCDSDKDNYGIVMSKSDPDFENGTGRQFLIKWANTTYSESTYEFERDLILNDVEYKQHVEAHYRRSKKPTKPELKKAYKQGEEETRRSYKIFGDESRLSDEERDSRVQAYQKDLEDHVFCNGGQLRDYQAVGVSWLMANHVNQRGSILADEMGLGKTIQTAVYLHLVATKLKDRGPFLIVAPLSTIPHWHREFTAWTDLNTIIYHGTAKDRELIREFEMAYEVDRPKDGSVGFNQSYLRKCLPKKRGKKNTDNNNMVWMAQVVITTPEMLVTEDYSELTAIHWDVLVVDEAHRLKNHSSKLANNLRDERFQFEQTLLLTGTPIQNNMTELWTLLNIVDSESFDCMDTFLKDYGDIKSKDKIDELHERIRPFILRRLKEDVEKSVPPKEETLIEVELTLLQKQYYRALYERNVQFLHRNKKKALDGPSINNLAMQLRKCCNHPFLLNGVEEEVRTSQETETNEGDFLAKASGKLVLLDKLLPRLREGGHRVLLFSQFKIMLDILEDYLSARSMKFERIDGSITGSKRQMAIDRFQAVDKEGDTDAPFIMLLSTRAGGVGINLTAADTCIIFDSDWNPQNDLQAQARCHRIGQTKSVKVYRLLSRKSYEMQMFHMSSLKMGLDQAVLQGFESGRSASDEGAMTKEEVERLLRHGAYDIFNEEKAGSAEAESNDFVQQDIDSILARRSRKVVHENTGSKSNAAGGTFSKASFKAAKSPSKKGSNEDVDIDDPEFWKKMVGEGKMERHSTDLAGKKRRRNQANYSERDYARRMNARLIQSDSDDDDSSSSSQEADSDASEDWSQESAAQKDPVVGALNTEDLEAAKTGESNNGVAAIPHAAPNRKRVKKKKKKVERSKWGGGGSNDWEKVDVEKLVKSLQLYGYGNLPWEEFSEKIDFPKRNDYSVAQIKRMSWSLALSALREAADEDVVATRRRAERAAEKQREAEDKSSSSSPDNNGGVLATSPEESSIRKRCEEDKNQLVASFSKLWSANAAWASGAVKDALAFSAVNPPRAKDVLSQALREGGGHGDISAQADGALAQFVRNIWPSLKSRGWTSNIETEGKYAGSTHYHYEGKQYRSPEAVLRAVPEIHPELSNAVETVLSAIATAEAEKERARLLEAKNADLESSKVTAESLSLFLQMYAPLPLVVDRNRHRKITLPRKILNVCCLLQTAKSLVENCSEESNEDVIDKLSERLCVHKRLVLPHPSWTARHDAVLISAIAKHGWIDHDSCCRAITGDDTIKWGAPFEDVDPEETRSSSQSPPQEEDHANEASFDMLKKTAERAAFFFSLLYDDLIASPDTRGFNENLVVKAYGLERTARDGEEMDQSTGWTVNEKALQGVASSNSSSEDEESKTDDPVDLPNKKELLRRAKSVLSNPLSSLLKPSSDVPNSREDTPPPPTHKYVVLDQSDRCNIFLAELLRGALKTPISKMRACRNLCLHAISEAIERREDLTAKDIGGEYDATSAEVSPSEELQKISVQLEQVRIHLSSATRQAKNILRVTLGVAPLPGKNGNEDLFPPETKKSVKPESAGEDGVEGKRKTSRKRQREKNNNASGDRAITRAMSRAFTGDDGAKMFSDPSESTNLELTATETLLLSVISSQGLPVWTPHWNDLIDTTHVDPELQGPGNVYAISWHGMGVVAETAAKVWHTSALDKLTSKREEFEQKFPDDIFQNSQEAARFQRKIAALEIDERSKKRTAQIAADYRNDPLKLAKKCVMLLEALRVRMGQIPSDKRGGPTHFVKKENYLGYKVFRWLGKELARWAESLSMTDGNGRPLANTAAEFIVGIPRYHEDDAYRVAAVLDKKLCRTVFAQIAQQSRTRSVFLKKTDSEMMDLVESAARNSHQAEDKWEKPSWWGVGDSEEISSVHYDYELLSGLLEFGFSGFEEMLQSRNIFCQHVEETQDDSETVDKLTRINAQQRANQLTRELSDLDESANIMKMVLEQRVRNGPGSRVVSDGNDTGSSAKPSPTHAFQTGIQAFFSRSKDTAAAANKNETIIVLSDSDDVKNPAQSDSDDSSVQVIGTTNKRKEEVSDLNAETSSAEKKPRTA